MRLKQSDNWGIYGTLVAAMGEAGEQLWDTLFTEALVNPPNWIDGAAFYSNSRKYGPSTINNEKHVFSAQSGEKTGKTV